MGVHHVYLVGWEGPPPDIPGVSRSGTDLFRIREGAVPPWSTVLLAEGHAAGLRPHETVALLRARRLLGIVVCSSTEGARPSAWRNVRGIRVTTPDALRAELGSERTVRAIRDVVDPLDWLPSRDWSSAGARRVLAAAQLLGDINLPIEVRDWVCAYYGLGPMHKADPLLLAASERAFLRLTTKVAGTGGQRLLLRYVATLRRACEAAGLSPKETCGVLGVAGPSSLARTCRRAESPEPAASQSEADVAGSGVNTARAARRRRSRRAAPRPAGT